MSLAFLFLGLAPHVLAQNFVPLAPIPGLTDIQPTSGGLAAFFNNLYKFLIGLAAVLAIIEIIWGGLEISTKDSVSKQSDGKERITQAIFGLILVLSPVLVFSIINPSILNLSLNLPPLDLKVTPAPAPTQVQPDQFGCTDNTQCASGYQCIGFIQGRSAGTCRSTKIELQPATIRCGFTQEKDCKDNSSVCVWLVPPLGARWAPKCAVRSDVIPFPSN